MPKPVQYLLTFERTDDQGRVHKRFVTQTVYGRELPAAPPGATVERKRYKKIKLCVPPWRPSEEWYKQQAISYARWLAERDGIKLPNRGEIRVDWAGVESRTRKRKHTGWDGITREFPIYEKRIRSISWGKEEPRYNERKDGRQGAWLYNEFVPDATIEIPNWDFEPDLPTEEIVGIDDIARAA